jgi:hypothetical protein
MNILKYLKNNKLSEEAAGGDFKLEIRGSKIYIGDDNSKSMDTDQRNDDTEMKQNQPHRLTTIEMSEYLLDSNQILLAISNEIAKNPLLVGSVLKHKEQKTFKYIIRNVISLKYLKIIGKQKQIVFEEDHDELDLPVNIFLRRMLLNTHLLTRSRKVYRQEARKVFVKEIVKNLTELDIVNSNERK